MPELVIQFWGFVHFFGHADEIHEVLRVRLWAIAGWDNAFVVNLRVFIRSFFCESFRFITLLVEVFLISPTENVGECGGLVEPFDREFAISLSQSHSLTSC